MTIATTPAKQATLWPDVHDLSGATEHQQQQTELATRWPIGILGGNPGAGKTWLSGRLIREVVRQHGADQVALCAPTGKAGVRLTEALAGHGVNLAATTIHRLLGVQRNGHDGKGWGFLRGPGCRLPQRFVFVDEASMLSTSLANSLASALKPGAHLLFVGDFSQLPPVDDGAPLRDLIAAGIPYGELSEIHRNAGDIVRACGQLKSGVSFTPSPRLDLAAGHNLWHHETRRTSGILGKMRQLIAQTPADLDPVWDVQVVTATNESSDLGRQHVNPILQRLLNPAGEAQSPERARIWLGDKVICTSNSPFLTLLACPSCGYSEPELGLRQDGLFFICDGCGVGFKANELDPEFVANGEIGQVVTLDKGSLHVRFGSPARVVRVSGEFVRDFDLGYAITTHKAQGSQWPVVICLADDSRSGDRVTSWEWWRTAFSRAERICVTIGPKAAIDRQCRRSSLADRKTFLRELVAAGLAA